ncbi:hypothetical protein H9Q71_006028 [Fusarium xylarioides]|nr:hypothetical protein H9Q71_006028 [Fusarium xylarioides]
MIGFVGGTTFCNVIINCINLEVPGNLDFPAGEPSEGCHFDGFKGVVSEAMTNGSLLVAQVSHTSRQVQDSVNANPMSISYVQLVNSSISEKTFAAPRPAAEGDIANIINSLAHASEFLDNVGFNGIELHGARGYLLAQFLSPRTNKRTDGTMVVANSIEYTLGGIDNEDFKAFAVTLENAKREENSKREKYFLIQAEEIVEVLKRDMKIFSTRGFKSIKAMVDSLQVIDGVFKAVATADISRIPASPEQ